MSLPGIRIEGGITIEGGIYIGTLPTFTINSVDISNPQLYYGGYSSYSPSGFVSNGNTNLQNGIRYDITTVLYNAIAAAQTTAGLNASNAWVWSASFASGGTVLVRLGLVSGLPNTVTISPIDQTDTRWQTGSDLGPTVSGSFTFPATFAPYSPPTSINGNDSWC
jgi:hypothetical protein